MNFFKASLVILYVIIIGYGLIRVLLRDKNFFSIYGYIPVSFVAGFSLLAFWANWAMLAGLRLSFLLLALPLLPLFIYGLTWLDLRLDFHQLVKKIRSLRAPELVLILVILFGIGSVFLMSIVFPLFFTD